MRNSIGWSGFSPVLIAKAATVPLAPPKPVLLTVSGTSISLQLYESLDNGGDSIIGYELWMDDGLGGSLTNNSGYISP